MNCDLQDTSLDHSRNQKRVLFVVLLTLGMMIIEIIAGALFGSMALLADGIHMGTHFFALSITLVAYFTSQRNQRNPKFSFGTGKISSLGGYSSAIILLLSAVGMIAESLQRFFYTRIIDFNQSILVAVLGLLINLLCAFLLRDSHHHEAHAKENHSHDHNLKAAYLHVIADALTSFAAIFALLAAKHLGLIWLDPFVGIVGGLVIIRWGVGLLQETGSVLLDFDSNQILAEQTRNDITRMTDKPLLDFHLWRLDENRRAVICKFESLTSREKEKLALYFSKNRHIHHYTIDR